jgi:hypothetical protein
VLDQLYFFLEVSAAAGLSDHPEHAIIDDFEIFLVEGWHFVDAGVSFVADISASD